MLVIILARKGSKRCVNKNIRPFTVVGRSILHTCVSKASYLNSKIVLNTDYEDVKKYLPPDVKVEVMMRDKELCGDDVTSEAVVKSVLDRYPDDNFCLMQATSPMLEISSLMEARTLLTGGFVPTNYDSVIAVAPNFQPCGAFYFCKKKAFDEHGTWWTPNAFLYTLDWKEAFDINTDYEFSIAQALHSSRVR
ncbi:MAG: hypothetical protein PHI12_13635 [Dehalococcoidales bacterium]|nr:hypothetical protein [Dehalococcoidales bacterium]